MKLIIGLGNVGNRYAQTRHNVGFLALNHYTQNRRVRFEHKTKLGADIAKDGEIIYAKPITMMNRSGQAVKAIADYYKIEVEDILIIYDELALPFGTVRCRKAGESAGHNGIKSIINNLSSDEFIRIRIGINNEHKSRLKAETFVLQDFTKSEKAELDDIFSIVDTLISSFIEDSDIEPQTHQIEKPQE